VIGASAGGVEALTALVADLAPDLQTAVLVAVHIPPFAESTLPAILNRAGHLPAAQASDAEPLRSGRIYVAPPDRHLVVLPDRARVTRGPRENGHRPAIDALFRSAAVSYGPACIGVVLSGILDDGAAGLRAIKAAGGLAIVQSDAAYADMPRNAIEAADVDHVEPLGAIAKVIEESVATLPDAVATKPPAWTTSAPYQATEEPGPPSEVTCPACGGVLTVSGEDPLRFRCRVGHAYNLDSLLANQNDALEQSLWTALRALEERSALLDRMSSRAAKRGDARHAERFAEDRDVVDQRAAIVRRAILEIDASDEADVQIAGAGRDDEPTDVAG
jgi:two-component system chemotaxis response regulator CheB